MHGASPCGQVVFQISLFAGCNEAGALLDFAFDRALAGELKTQTTAAAMTRREWAAAFRGVVAAVGKANLGTSEASIERGLQCTLKEQDQKSRWTMPVVRLLTYIALHSQEDVEEKIADVLGEIIRTDARRLEDVRTQLEQGGADILTLSEAVCSVSNALGLL